MNPSEAEFWQAGVRRRTKDTACPKLVWAYIHAANRRSEPWQRNRDEWVRKLLRTIARSPTIFPSKNLDLKSSLRELDLEWLKPSQVSRIRECLAPERKVPRHRFDRWFSRYGESKPRSPKCKKLFWAWRHDQKTCDLHLGYASMFRVQKHRKGKQTERQNRRQLKEARQQLKRKRRAYKRLQKLIRITPAPPLTATQLQAQNDRDDLRLLRWIRLGYEVEAKDSERLQVMITDGYVVPDAEELNTYRLSGQGLQLVAELRKRVGRGPALG